MGVGPGRSATLIVVPTFREAENIDVLLRRIRGVDPDIDILIVDGASPDHTAELARRVGATLGRVEVLVTETRGGLGGAYRVGFRHALEHQYRSIVQMDADLSHEPEAIPALLRALHEREADLVIGSRYIGGGSIPTWSMRRRALSRWGNRYAALALGIPVTDATSGFRAHRAEALARAGFDHTTTAGYGFQIEIAYRAARADCRIEEVPIRFVDRVRGSSKMSTRIALEAFALVTWWSVRDHSRDLYRRVRARRVAFPAN